MKSVLFVLSLLCVTLLVKAQNYDDVFYYSTNTTPVNGVKLKTNLPFTNSSQMVTIILEGYAYSTGDPMNLTLTYYIYGGAFINSRVSTAASHTPNITLANENGKVSIFVDSKIFYQRFHVRAFAGGNGEQAAWFTGWSAVDSLLIGTATASYQIPYVNKFTGNVIMPGGGIWNSTGNVGVGTVSPPVKLSVYGPNNNDGAISIQSNVDSRFYIAEGDNMLRIGGLNATTGVINVINTGNVGIGTTSPGSYKLAVEGTIGARKVQVKQTSWADFVFQQDYQLMPLLEVENYVLANKHLPDVPSAVEVEKNGQDLGEMNKILLQKVEELTLYLIRQEKRIEQLETAKK
ncbi:hypothetical protein SAMN05428988_0368 [Chitinophaga sp. YR573]|uniref:hypothetical protein n=1 Tax=Chitinophaga sp. YR573 TaxID=1881040 RepID=UPI0008B670A5|nr:hypothetical protein [Chitinophaga sp. YR573]SEV91120.1 hypothetical protein SAMN05428988_0368 [Chitinophaga sp. YR573]